MSLSPADIEYQRQHIHETRVPNMIAAFTCLTILAYSAVALRLYARKVTGAGFGWDDGLIIGGLVFHSAYVVCGGVEIANGEGRHMILLKDPVAYSKAYVSSITFYATAVTLIKASILCFYCRIFYSKRLARVCWGFGAFVFLYNLAVILVDLLQCIPLSALWTGQQEKCISVTVPLLTLGSINAFTDFVILIIPLRKILKLHMSRRRRLQLCGIFALGGVVTIFGIIRVVVHPQIVESDITYTSVNAGIWSNCEVTIGIVCACLPTFAGLAGKVKLSSRSSSIVQFIRSRLSSTRKSSYDDQTTMAERGQGQNDDSSPTSTRPTHHYRVWTDNKRDNKRDSFFDYTRAFGSTATDDSDLTRHDTHQEGKITVQLEVEQSIQHN